MSGKRKKDNKKMLKAILRLIQDCNVEKFVMNFEMALWSAVRSIFPMAKLLGCAIHWKQAVNRKVQSSGLAVPYASHRPRQDFIRKVMTLPFFPEEYITRTFCHLASHAPVGLCLDLMTYMQEIWISGLWPSGDWTEFDQSIRTNKEIEGYHRQLNGSASSSQLL